MERRGLRALVAVAAVACAAAIAFIAAVENQPEAGRRELVASSSWPAKDQSYYYWSDATAHQGEVQQACCGVAGRMAPRAQENARRCHRCPCAHGWCLDCGGERGGAEMPQ